MSFERDSNTGTTNANLYPMASGITSSFVGNPIDISQYDGVINIDLMGKGANGSTLDIAIIPSGVTGPGAPLGRFTQVTSTGSFQTLRINSNDADQYIIPSGTVVGSVSFGIGVVGRKQNV